MNYEGQACQCHRVCSSWSKWGWPCRTVGLAHKPWRCDLRHIRHLLLAGAVALSPVADRFVSLCSQQRCSPARNLCAYSKSCCAVWCRPGAAAGSCGRGGTLGAGDDGLVNQAPEVCGRRRCRAQHRSLPDASGRRPSIPVSTAAMSAPALWYRIVW
jgi:hypothetical protein